MYGTILDCKTLPQHSWELPNPERCHDSSSIYQCMRVGQENQCLRFSNQSNKKQECSYHLTIFIDYFDSCVTNRCDVPVFLFLELRHSNLASIKHTKTCIFIIKYDHHIIIHVHEGQNNERDPWEEVLDESSGGFSQIRWSLCLTRML